MQVTTMKITDSCTAVVINYQTPDLTTRAIHSLRKYYPGLSLLLIDNGSRDESRKVLETISSGNDRHLRVVFNPSNLHHGPAMDWAARTVESSYIAFLDSDCEIRQGGFLEQMVDRLEQSGDNYAIGKLTFMDNRGFDVLESTDAIRYVRPICMVLKRGQYLTLPPFRHHGAPCLQNMKEAGRRGLVLLNFPVEDFVYHQGRGTAVRHGYGLGWKGKLNHLLHKMGL